MSSQNETESCDDSEDPPNPQLTELVAYLDGELGDEDSNRLEQQLATDAPLRNYADTLDRTWQLLNSLGEATASGEFTQKTLASLQAVSRESQYQTAPKSLTEKLGHFRRLPFLRIGLWIVVGFLGCSIGLVSSRVQRPTQKNAADMQLLQQLDLLQEYQKIRPVPSAEFLTKLSAMENSAVAEEIAP